MNKENIFNKMIKNSNSTKEKLFLNAVYLFSIKGYDGVGIRELCKNVNIKESSFYNHYKSKNELLLSIFSYFNTNSEKTLDINDEIKLIIDKGDIDLFFEKIMKKFSSITDNPLFFTILQIINMLRYTNPIAYNISKNNLYYIRSGFIEKSLKMMQEKGFIKNCDISQFVTEYFYGLMGFLDEYLLLQIGDEDTTVIYKKIINHINFFSGLLKK